MFIFFLSDVDECLQNICVNAHSCQNLGGDYLCKCHKGWSGKNCTTNTNDCIGQCQNGATCIDLVNDYHCACQPGFTGDNSSLFVTIFFLLSLYWNYFKMKFDLFFFNLSSIY